MKKSTVVLASIVVLLGATQCSDGGGGREGTGGAGTGTGGATSTGSGGSTTGTGGSTTGTGGSTTGTGGSTTGSGGSTTGSGGSAAAGGSGTGAAGAAGAAGTAGGAGGRGTGGRGTGGRGTGGAGGRGTGGAGTGGVGTGGAAAGTGGAGGAGQRFSFFVTSLSGLLRLSKTTTGFGGDFRYGEADGLTGADKICSELAEGSMPGAGQKQWRAFLSATAGPGGQPVNAIDRVGPGPWYDRLGRVLAMTVADLRNTRPVGAHSAIVNDLPNEFGVPNSNPDGSGMVDNHHVITGSNQMGQLNSTVRGNTCNDWTSAVGTTGRPMSGFSWPRGGGAGTGSGSHWLSGFSAYGCAPGVSIVQDGAGNSSNLTVGEGGGYGAFYCFALVP